MHASIRHMLIDGYNLIHALGVQPHRLAEVGLEAGRARLLNYLADRLDARCGDVTVIFDAAHAPRRLGTDVEHRGIQVQFTRGSEADDVIEERIGKAAIPHALAIVSNDRRLIRAAERRGCLAVRCDEFIDWLEEHGKKCLAPEDAGRPTRPLPDADKEHWLAEFRHLDDDPTLGEPPLFTDD
jgi:predicted RNA-binding protein with PIN domain